MSDLLLGREARGQRWLKKKERKEVTVMAYYVVNGVVFFKREEAVAYKKECK